MASLSTLARREVLRTSALLALLSGLGMPPLQRAAAAATKGGGKRGPKPPRYDVKIKRAKGKASVVGPFGEVRFIETEQGPVPNYLAAASGGALVDLTHGRFEAAIGKIRLTSAAIDIAGKAFAWNEAGFEALIAALAKDRKTARAILNLRGAVLLEMRAYEVRMKNEASYVDAYVRMLEAVNGAAPVAGAKSFLTCTETTIRETVYSTISETIDVIRTAEQQYQECLADERDRDVCGRVPPGDAKDACAAGVCALKSFVDVVTGTITVLTEISEEVIRKVTTCTATFPPGQWPTPVDLPDPFKALPGFGNGGKAPAIGKSEIRAALQLLKAIPIFGGPIGTALLDGNWEITPLPAAIDLGGGAVTSAYGASVALTNAAAQILSNGDLWQNSDDLWVGAVSVMAALEPAFAASAGAAGVVVDSETVAAAAAGAATVSAVVVAVILVVVAVIAAIFTFGAVTGLVVGTILAVQIATGVTIQMAAIAVALIAMLPPFGTWKGLAPPIVTI